MGDPLNTKQIDDSMKISVPTKMLISIVMTGRRKSINYLFSQEPTSFLEVAAKVNANGRVILDPVSFRFRITLSHDFKQSYVTYSHGYPPSFP